CEIVREPGDRICLFGLVAPAVAAQIDRDCPMSRGEVFRLRREVGVIAGPAVYEQHRRSALPCGLEVKLHPVASSVLHRSAHLSSRSKQSNITSRRQTAFTS